MDDKYPDRNLDHSLDLLESMTRRDFDLELFADKVESDYLLRAPLDLAPEIRKQAARPEVQLEIHARRLSKRTQLLLYSVKVGTAVVGALLLLSLSSGLRGGQQFYRIDNRYSSAVTTIQESGRQLSDYMNDFSNNLFQNGGFMK